MGTNNLIKAEKEIREYYSEPIVWRDSEIPVNNLFCIRGIYADYYISQKFVIAFLKS